MKTVKWLGILLAGAIALGGCADQTAQKDTILELEESALNAPQTITVERGDLQVVTYYDAQVGPKIQQLTFADGGTFGEFKVQLGDSVQKGQTLAIPATEELEKEIEAKEKELESLTKTYEYKKATLENSLAIANKELEKSLDTVDDMIEASQANTAEFTNVCRQAGTFDEQRKKLELQLKQLKETYDLELPHCEKQLKELQEKCNGNLIKAPFDGIIVALAEAEYGDPLNESLYYVAVADTSVTYARCVSVSNASLERFQKILFWADGKEYEAVSVPMTREYYIATQNNNEDAYSEFEITDPDGELSMGDYGKMMLISTEKKDVLLVPETVIQSSGGKKYVYKDVDGRHERVIVETGSTDGINVEIIEGLEEGDVVYVQE